MRAGRPLELADWFRRYRPLPAPAARLVCFPHAGGGASFFRRWAEDLPSGPAGVELLAGQYPGREERLAEPPATDLPALAGSFVAALGRHRDRPVALLGHSLGAAVAYEVAHQLQATPAGPPALLVVSGRPAPADPGRLVHRMGDDAIWAELGRAGGTDPRLLASPELRALLLPVLRADYRLSETYRPAGRPALRCPILACGGEEDPDLDPALLSGWAARTAAGTEVRTYPGDHFFLTRHRRALIGEVIRKLGGDPGGVSWPVLP
jgi:pyochelin biosynthetic protein PchC